MARPALRRCGGGHADELLGERPAVVLLWRHVHLPERAAPAVLRVTLTLMVDNPTFSFSFLFLAATLEVWMAQARRDYRRKAQTKPSLKEGDYLLDLFDMAKGRLARAIVTLERKNNVPSTLDEFEKLITDTYRIKPAGQRAFDQFKIARQQKRTPRAYLLQLEDWAAIYRQPGYYHGGDLGGTNLLQVQNESLE